MKRLWSFTRLVNGDDDILELHLKENPRLYETWSSKDLELRGASVSFIERQKNTSRKKKRLGCDKTCHISIHLAIRQTTKGCHPYKNVFSVITAFWKI